MFFAFLMVSLRRITWIRASFFIEFLPKYYIIFTSFRFAVACIVTWFTTSKTCIVSSVWFFFILSVSIRLSYSSFPRTFASPSIVLKLNLHFFFSQVRVVKSNYKRSTSLPRYLRLIPTCIQWRRKSTSCYSSFWRQLNLSCHIFRTFP